jgi:copper homeostasis protein CutC
MVWNVGSKHVEEVDNLRLEICSSLKSGGSTVSLESKHVEG